MGGRPPRPDRPRGDERDGTQLEPHYPEPPAYLDEEEREAWRRFGQDLEPLRVVTRVDWAVLELLVTSWVQGQRLRARLRAAGGGLVYESERKDGGVMMRARPEVAMLNELDRKCAMLLSRFGLTPSDRARLSPEPAPPVQHRNPEDEFKRRD
jgi:P27 family predicted phage terminase small subunit